MFEHVLAFLIIRLGSAFDCYTQHLRLTKYSLALGSQPGLAASKASVVTLKFFIKPNVPPFLLTPIVLE